MDCRTQFGKIHNMTIIDLETFLELPTADVAKLVRAAGTKVCVFPINGTRRWFMLEHGRDIQDDPVKAYLNITTRSHIEIYKLCFTHGNTFRLRTPRWSGLPNVAT